VFTDSNAVLDSKDIVTAQCLSPKLLKLARDNTLWRYKCFEESPSAALASRRLTSFAALTGALDSLSISDPPDLCPALQASQTRQYTSKRAQAVADWDLSHPSEEIDWYSEYIARHATLSTSWLEQGNAQTEDVRGIALLGDSGKVVGPLEDGSLCIWDISPSRSGRRRFREVARALPRTLFEDPAKPGGPSSGASALSFSGAVECINADLARKKTYVAVHEILNEVDLSTLQLVSQQKYAWPITALSKESAVDQALTVGTSWSLHLYDPRCQIRDRSRSPEDLLRTIPGDPEDSIAFLPNYNKTSRRSPPSFSLPNNTLLAGIPTQLGTGPRQSRRPNLSEYAQIEPGPLSILHQGPHDILIAGRFPSILSYDRRYFPRLQYAIHSGARLSTITSMPVPPRGAGSNSSANATLIAAGEYGGRGSLELYSLPHVKPEARRSSADYGLPTVPAQLGTVDREHALDSAFAEAEYPFSYKNRQAASTSKLLAVATQGTRVVFSDAEGGLKWVERNGIGLVRKWNINTFETDERGARVVGEQVIRKIIPLEAGESDRGSRGDGDLLIWTGEKVGIVSTKPSKKKNETPSESDADTPEEQGAEYSRQMRRALERQADEVRTPTDIHPVDFLSSLYTPLILFRHVSASGVSLTCPQLNTDVGTTTIVGVARWFFLLFICLPLADYGK
jgi:hypothetical protein